MKKFLCAMSIIAVLSCGLTSCKSKSEIKTEDDLLSSEIMDATHNSRNSLDWEGSYTGTVPCADCEGINVQIILNSDESFQLIYQYLGKKDNSTHVETGVFTWDNDGATITLDCKNWAPYYAFGENKLIQLDMERKIITGELADKYVLTKIVESSDQVIL